MPTAQTDGAIKQIVNAFAAVSLGDGISLREADVIDAYGTADEQTAGANRMNFMTGNGFQMTTLKTVRPPSVSWTTKVCGFIFPHTCDLRFDGIVNRNP